LRRGRVLPKGVEKGRRTRRRKQRGRTLVDRRGKTGSTTTDA